MKSLVAPIVSKNRSSAQASLGTGDPGSNRWIPAEKLWDSRPAAVDGDEQPPEPLELDDDPFGRVVRGHRHVDARGRVGREKAKIRCVPGETPVISNAPSSLAIARGDGDAVSKFVESL